MEFLLILRLLQRKIWILVGIPIVTVILTGVLLSRMDKKFKSTAQIATGLTTKEGVNLGEENSNPFDIANNFTNIIESMNSIPVLSLVSYRLILHDLEDQTPFRRFKPVKNGKFAIDQTVLNEAAGKFKKRLADFKPLNSFEEEDRLLFEILKGYEYDYETLIKKLWIRRISTSDFISVDYTSENSQLSALAVNSVCEEFIRYNKALKVDRSSESVGFLENLVAEKKKVMDQKTAALNEYKVVNNVTNYNAESESKIDLIAEYELNREEEDKKIKALKLSIEESDRMLANGQKSNQKEVMQVNQRVVDLRRQIADLNTSGADRDKLQRLRDELSLEVGRLENMTKNTSAADNKQLEKDRDDFKLQLRIAESNLAAIESSLRKLKYDVSGFATKEARLADLERELTFATEDYANVQDKFNEAKNKGLVVGSSIRLTLRGQPSLEAEPSKFLMLTGLAGIGSLVLCVMVILGVEYLDFSIRIPARLTALTGLANIGSINLVNAKNFDLHRIFNDANKSKESEVFIHFMRKLRYEVQSSKSKVFLITSTQVNVGKSFLIICLSYTLSLINKKVLIIDTNFRHNSLTRLLLPKKSSTKLLQKGSFGDDEKITEEASIPAGKNEKKFEFDEDGSTASNGANSNANKNGKHQSKTNQQEEPAGQTSDDDYIHTSAEEEEDHNNIIQNTAFKGVSIIGNVGGHDSPSEILAGRDFKNVIKNLASQYDYILMEGPSLNEYSDTKELTEYAEKVITVFGADSVISSLDKESITYLKSMKGKLLGAVLNKVEVKNLSV